MKKKTQTTRQESRRELNLPLLIGTVLTVAVLAPVIYFWHAFQLQRTAGALLSRAQTFEEEDNWLAAAEYVNRYLSLEPDDVDARIRLAENYERGADTNARRSRAVDLYYRALGLAQDEKAEIVGKLRTRLAEILLELGRFRDAEQQATQIDDPEQQEKVTTELDPAALRLLALAIYGQQRLGTLEQRDPSSVDAANPYKVAACDPVMEVVERALKASDPPDVQLTVALASTCRANPHWLSEDQRADFSQAEDGQPQTLREKARKLMDELRDSHKPKDPDQPEDPDVLLAHYAFVVDEDKEEAETDVKRAVAAAPDNVGVRLVAGEYYRTRAAQVTREADEAEKEAELARQNGDSEAADEHLAAAIESREVASQSLDAAKPHYEQLRKIAPDLPAAYVGLGDVLLAQGESEAALSTWRQGLANIDDAPRTVDLHLRLTEALITTEKLDEAKDALEALDLAIQTATPRVTKAARNAWGRASSLRWTQLYLKQENYLEAAPLLERLTSDTGQMAAGDEAALWAMLGRTRAALAEWDNAAAAYETAANLDLKNLRYHEAAGAAWASAGRPEAAIRQFASVKNKSPEATIAYTRALLQQELQKPKGDRNWDQFEKSLAGIESLVTTTSEAEQPLNEPWRIPMLRADYEFALDTDESRAAALETLSEIEKDYGDVPEVCRRLVFIYEKIGEKERADATLERLTVSDEPHTVVFVRARLMSQRDKHAEARELLEAAIKQFPSEAESLRLGLVQISVDQGRFDQATRDLANLGGRRDLARLRQLAELSLSNLVALPPSRDRVTFRKNLERSASELEKWEKELRKVEGEEGTYWRYYRARRLTALAESPHDARLIEAAQLQSDLATQRPQWPASHVLQGMIADRSGRINDAIAAYAEAIRLGERRLNVHLRLIFLLEEVARFAEAESYLARMEDQIPASSQLSALALNLAAETHDHDRAVDLAAAAVRERPLDPMAHVWHGQMLLLRSNTAADEEASKRDRAKAEQSLQYACKLTEDKDVRPLNGLFSFYVRTGENEKALETLQHVQKVASLDDATRAFVMAQGYELLEERQLAEKNYLTARRLAQDSTAIPLRMAAFFLRSGELERSEAALRQVLEIDPTVRPARRTLAAILAARGGEEEWQEIRQLLGPDVGEEGQLSHLDERLQAVLLARRGRSGDIDEAYDILSQLVDQAVNTTPGDRILLAWTCVKKSEAPALDDRVRLSLLNTARRQYVVLASQREVNPTHLALYIDFLLKQKDWKSAETNIAKLEELEPDAARSINLRARWLKATDRAAEIDQLVQNWVARLEDSIGDEPTDEQRKLLANRCLQAGKIYSGVKEHAKAEGWYRRVLEEEQSVYGPLVISLARQESREKTQQALQICLERARDATTVAPAVVLASVLVTGTTEPSDFAAAEPIFRKWMQQEKDNADLLLAVGNVRYLQENLGEAERLFSRVIELRPRDVVAHNNLATLLSEIDGREQEAMKHVQRAIELSGEQPALLDTKGMILVNEDQVSEAVDVLRRAAGADDSDPRFVLHLVIALDRAGEQQEARRQWRRVDLQTLNRMLLSTTDKRERDRFASQFGSD